MVIRAKAFLFFCASLIVLAVVLFIPAGTLGYWQAWMYLVTLFIPVSFVVLYFLKNDPAFLERRMKFREREVQQKLVAKFFSILSLVGFVVPGLDHRFGWSSIPPEASVAADAFVLLGYLLCFLVFRENSFAGRTIEVVKGQKVISTGPYAFVRHPMYSAVILMYAATPLALGSYLALPFFLLLIPVLVMRIRNEEEILSRGLPGYDEYRKKVRFRLVPHLW